jgi:VIT1/CCC1 family predicted Fe2+/Mn2+ transporter
MTRGNLIAFAAGFLICALVMMLAALLVGIGWSVFLTTTALALIVLESHRPGALRAAITLLCGKQMWRRMFEELGKVLS